ncbi:MAG: hypothetical protein JRI36_00455 [Deltaproteobacteria bacterium]|nr:hypothetical protein [Deltaproteobacteria bacterium]
MSRIVIGVVVLMMAGAMLLSLGCAKRQYYANTFGRYTLFDADVQYEALFQMKPYKYRQFLTFKDGWWRVDVVKMRKMGVSVPELCERYCRSTDIKVPFPVLIDYRLIRDNA